MLKKVSFAILLLLPVFALANSLGDISALHFAPPATDLSVKYLGDIFGNVGTVLHGDGSQIMGKIFAIFNAAVLSLAGIILTYLFFMGILNTAQDGELMGKRYASIWTPFRAVIGLSLLIPKKTGYSFVQVFVMWLVIQGVGAADSMWNAAIQYLETGGTIISASYEVPTVNGTQRLVSMPANLFNVETCTAALEKTLKDQRDNPKYSYLKPVPDFLSNLNPLTNGKKLLPVDYPVPNISTTQYPYYSKFNGLCGDMKWNDNLKKNSSTALKRLAQARTVALQQVFDDFQGPANQVISNYNLSNPEPYGSCQLISGNIGSCGPGSDANTPTWFNNQASLFEGGLINNAAKDYFSIMAKARAAYNQAVAVNVNNPLNPGQQNAEKANMNTLKDADKQGWITAGAYYFDLVNLNHNLATTIGPPPAINFDLKKQQDSMCDIGGKAYNLFKATSYCNQLHDYLFSGPSVTVPNQYPANTLPNFITSATKYIPSKAGDNSASSHANGYFKGTLAGLYITATTANVLIAATASLGGPAITVGIWPMNAAFQIMISVLTADVSRMHDDFMGSGSHLNNPLLVAAHLGNDLMDMSTLLWIAGLGFLIGAFFSSLIPSINMATAAVVAVGWIIPIVVAIMAMSFTAGVFLAVYVPFIPFLIFTFSAIGWFIAVIEAMVAAPIVAIGLIYPEGHEIWGKADQGLMLMLNVFLRPGMMIIGLIAGISLSYVGVWLLSQGFWYVASSAIGGGALSWGWAFVGTLVVYVAAVVAVVNKSCQLIYLIPDKILRWLSGGLQESFGSDAAGEAMQSVRGASGQFGSQSGQAFGQGTQGASSNWSQQNVQRARDEKASQDSAESDKSVGIESDSSGGGSGGGSAPPA